MEKELNIAEILKDKPVNTKLYSALHDDVYFLYTFARGSVMVATHGTNISFFGNAHYLYYKEGEPLLFPSKEMRDWSKFSWKKGDVLVSNDGGTEIIFNKWYDDTYTSFYGKHYLNSEDENNIKYNEDFLCTTERYSLEENNAAQCYINTIEERLGGKLNCETLKIEKTQPEFKDGDIVTATSDFGSIFIGILKKIIKDFPNKELRFYCALENSEQLAFGGLEVMLKAIKTSFATEEEKHQLFSALAKEGKAWDAVKKQIVDLKPKIELKPFDKVLARNSNTQKWEADLFSFKSDTGHYHCVGFIYNQCIPYEGNESLLGTTKDVEE